VTEEKRMDLPGAMKMSDCKHARLPEGPVTVTAPTYACVHCTLEERGKLLEEALAHLEGVVGLGDREFPAVVGFAHRARQALGPRSPEESRELLDAKSELERYQREAGDDRDHAMREALDEVENPANVPVGKPGTLIRRAWELGRELYEHRRERASAEASFEQAWCEMVARGYRYGADALERVKFGWHLREAQVGKLRDVLRKAGDRLERCVHEAMCTEDDPHDDGCPNAFADPTVQLIEAALSPPAQGPGAAAVAHGGWTPPVEVPLRGVRASKEPGR
jgi:hypothetical protein